MHSFVKEMSEILIFDGSSFPPAPIAEIISVSYTHLDVYKRQFLDVFELELIA